MPDLLDVNELDMAENLEFEAPVPTQMISNGEFTPLPQSKQQKQVEERIKELADEQAKRHGVSRRQFLNSTAGMAVGFMAMNEVFGGGIFGVSAAEAQEAGAADERANKYKDQFVFDAQTHMVHDGFDQEGLLGLGLFAGENWNPTLQNEELTLAYYKFDNYMRQMFVNSDTKVAVLSGAPFDDPSWTFISNDAIVDTRDMVNKLAGTQRMYGHHVITPGQDGWMDEVVEALEVKGARMDGWKAYTIGDPLSATTEHPYRLDDEELMYPFFEMAIKHGKTKFACHKGLMPADYETSWADKWQYNTPWDLLKPAQDFPEMDFIIYHSAMRPFLEDPSEFLEEFERTGELKWASDLCRTVTENGLTNVYAELGTTFANACVTHPRLAAALLGTLVKHLGPDHIVWGTDSVFYGSPQWQIEALRRIEIPEDMQEKHGFAPLGEADGLVKSAILGYNSARMFNIDLRADFEPMLDDGVNKLKTDFALLDGIRDNTRYGYISRT